MEDMFQPDFYLRMVSKEYDKALGKPLKTSDLPKGGPRIVPRIEQACQANGASESSSHPRAAGGVGRMGESFLTGAAAIRALPTARAAAAWPRSAHCPERRA